MKGKRRIKTAELLAFALAAGLAPGAGADTVLPKAGGAQGRPLLVYAGAGFRSPVEEAARIFSEREGVLIEPTFAGSGCLLAQAELAGRGDVFIPGEEHYLRQAQERDLAGTGTPLAYLCPVIAVALGNPMQISRLQDLGRPGLRVGLGDPQSVAVGLVAEAWLDAQLQPEQAAAVRSNVRTRALNVNELGSQLTLGALDVAIVWDATLPLFPKLEGVPLESGRAHRSLITGGVLRVSRQPELAASFLHFLASEDGAQIFRRHGYEPYASHERAP